MSVALARARPAMIGPCDLAGDRLNGLEVARRGDREAGLDDVDAEPRELVRDLELLGRVQRDARRLLAVAQRRVEDQYSVWIHVVSFLVSRSYGFTRDRFAASRPPARYSPRRGRRRSRRSSKNDMSSQRTSARANRNRAADQPSGMRTTITGRT